LQWNRLLTVLEAIGALPYPQIKEIKITTVMIIFNLLILKLIQLKNHLEAKSKPHLL